MAPRFLSTRVGGKNSSCKEKGNHFNNWQPCIFCVYFFHRSVSLGSVSVNENQNSFQGSQKYTAKKSKY